MRLEGCVLKSGDRHPWRTAKLPPEGRTDCRGQSVPTTWASPGVGGLYASVRLATLGSSETLCLARSYGCIFKHIGIKFQQQGPWVTH